MRAPKGTFGGGETSSGFSFFDRLFAPAAAAPSEKPSKPRSRAARANAPLPSYEIRVVGNVVRGRYVAGLVFISQQQLNNGAGTISCIDYATGALPVVASIATDENPNWVEIVDLATPVAS